ncbi:dihydrosphingosine phosphate lyase [Zygosaccharomyces mellis]|uniref:sphinganine-1-phosphate aldolase n=1 Tax=Zygosaccharomyces mellis TaxID=42258 RepID=A0A4C2E4N5_9SACH|nr:dihydrosphingosine phosphate lyase [Zygosaccharomyces mellis]
MESKIARIVEELKGLNLLQLVFDGYQYAALYLETSSWSSLIKDYLFLALIYKVSSRVFYHLKAFGILKTLKIVYHNIATAVFRSLLNSPILKPIVVREVGKGINVIERDLLVDNSSVHNFGILPDEGLSEQTTLEELDRLQELVRSAKWEDGKISGAVYHGGQELIHLQSVAFEKYCVANQLHPNVFPAVRKMESEVVSMVLDVFHAPKDTGCGTTSSGGTESILLACLSAKVYGYQQRGITEPEMILPVTAHAGFHKAAYYFGMKIRKAELDPVTYKVDLNQVKRLINGNTVLLVGSAPNYPHGIVDDIEGLGKLGQKYQIPLHVDCCLGSFVIAFMEKAGFKDIPPFDFRVPGVTSISCDTHKYGFAPKGSSVVMYRNQALRASQYYVSTDWIGGVYGSPTLAGSRPGALVVGCWATMVHFGKKGYTDSSREIITAARKLKGCMGRELPELQIIGDPLCCVVSFTSDQLNVYELGDKLTKLGWHLSALQKPPALHIAVTKLSINSIDKLIAELKAVVKEMKANPDQKPASDGTTALYGVAGSIKTTGVADKVVVGYLDTLYKLKPKSSQ